MPFAGEPVLMSGFYTGKLCDLAARFLLSHLDIQMPAIGKKIMLLSEVACSSPSRNRTFTLSGKNRVFYTSIYVCM